MTSPGTAPPRLAAVDGVAVGVIRRHGASVMRTARRYSRTTEDAEDAYQRGLEILFTRAPDIPEPELVAWLKTVVKHEAFAIRRRGDRVALGVQDSVDGEVGGEAALAGMIAGTDEQAERRERLRLGAEAMRQLKPHEVRALTLLAEGYTYKQICAITGWTYTKVNRCITEGRRSFLARVRGIETGEECRRHEPLLSAIADGEADARDLAEARAHLRGCLACKATLRDYRATQKEVAALLPLLPVSKLGAALDRVRGALESALDALRAGAVAARDTTPLAAAPKVAATVAAVAAAGGAGAAAVPLVTEDEPGSVSLGHTIGPPRDMRLPSAGRAFAVRARASAAGTRRRSRDRDARRRRASADRPQRAQATAAAGSGDVAPPRPRAVAPPSAPSAPGTSPGASPPTGGAGGEFSP